MYVNKDTSTINSGLNPTNPNSRFNQVEQGEGIPRVPSYNVQPGMPISQRKMDGEAMALSLMKDRAISKPTDGMRKKMETLLATAPFDIETYRSVLGNFYNTVVIYLQEKLQTITLEGPVQTEAKALFDEITKEYDNHRDKSYYWAMLERNNSARTKDLREKIAKSRSKLDFKSENYQTAIGEFNKNIVQDLGKNFEQMTKGTLLYGQAIELYESVQGEYEGYVNNQSDSYSSVALNVASSASGKAAAYLGSLIWSQDNS